MAEIGEPSRETPLQVPAPPVTVPRHEPSPRPERVPEKVPA